jgi:quaternary ammonium compound-resistance protein SugE
MAWVYLLIAGAIEIGWALGLSYTEGLTKHGLASAGTLAGMILSYVFLALAMRDLPVGTAYPVWTGIGAIGTAIFGMLVFGDSRDPLRIACIGLIVVGVVGLKWLHQ